MPTSEYHNCGNPYTWNWEEAFDKFGFNDGDGEIETYTVEEVLKAAGYEVRVTGWGIHNTIIISIKMNGIEQILETITIVYDDPREYLPASIVKPLDEEL